MASINALSPLKSPYHPYRANYEVKLGHSYTALYNYIDARKACLRVDDSTYVFLEWRDTGSVAREMRECVHPADRISVEKLHAPVEMISYNMQEVVDWLNRYVNDANAAINRGHHIANTYFPLGMDVANALLTAAHLRRVDAANTILGSTANSLLGRPPKR
jgi:hypothetical protein